MASDQLIRIYHELPYPLKVFTISGLAYIKRTKKYGAYFKRYFDFLVSNDIQRQKSEAAKELGKFLHYVKENSTYYAGYLQDEPDLTELPVIDKQEVLRNFNKILLQQPYLKGKSSGTSGQPIEVPYSISVYQKEYAFWWYHRSFMGIHRGDRIATLAGHKIADVRRDKPPFWVYNRTENQMFFSSYHLSYSNLRQYVKQLNRFRPHFIHGYPSSIFLVAQYILAENIELQYVPKMIVASSESLLDFQREAIETAFGCKVFVWYGNTELCGHITECLYGHLHVQPYHSFVRVLKNDGTRAQAGETGRIVATNFTNYSFPLINYDMKDIVKISRHQNCPCQRGGLILDYVIGRIEDYILTPEGRLVGRLDHLFKDATKVRNAQIVQNKAEQIILRIEREKNYSTAIEQEILKEARIRLGLFWQNSVGFL